MADAHSEEMLEAAEAVFDFETSLHKEGIEALYGAAVTGHDFLLIHHLENVPQYRRRGLGGKLVAIAKTTFGSGASLILVKPVPFEYLRLEEEERERRKAEFEEDSKRLLAFYESHGFRLIPGSGMMAFNPRC